MRRKAPRSFWKRLEHEHIKPALRYLKPWKKRPFGGINIYYKPFLDGGGSSFGQDFIPLLRAKGMPKVQRAFEWCAGPGFIGFSILGHSLSETLCLADINPAAVSACRATVRANGLADKVAVYLSDNLGQIPASEQWDLVVSNPPHFLENYDLRSSDPDWHIHKEFFETIAGHLAPGGVVILQENNNGSTVESFRAMIAQAGLKIVFAWDAKPELTPEFHFYYLGIMRGSDTPPAWARD